MVEFTKQLVLQQMAQYGQMPEGVDLDQIAHNVLGNREEAERIGDQLFERKLLEYFKSSFKIDEKEVTYDEFVKRALRKIKLHNCHNFQLARSLSGLFCYYLLFKKNKYGFRKRIYEICREGSRTKLNACWRLPSIFAYPLHH